MTSREEVLKVYPGAVEMPDPSGSPSADYCIVRPATKEDWPENKWVQIGPYVSGDPWAAVKLPPGSPAGETASEPSPSSPETLAKMPTEGAALRPHEESVCQHCGEPIWRICPPDPVPSRWMHKNFWPSQRCKPKPQTNAEPAPSAPEAIAAGNCYTRICGCTHPLISHAVSGRCIAQGCLCTDFQEVAAPIAPAAEELTPAHAKAIHRAIEADAVIGEMRAALEIAAMKLPHKRKSSRKCEKGCRLCIYQTALARAEEYRKGAKK